MFLIVFPGMISRILFTDEVACVTQAGCFFEFSEKNFKFQKGKQPNTLDQRKMFGCL